MAIGIFTGVKHVKTPIIKEHSTLARLAAAFRKEPRIAMVLGNTIHLYGVSAAVFQANKRWVKHEMAHIQQFRRYGTIVFLCRYIWESLKHGYFNNRYEVEARRAEEEAG